MSKQTAVDWLVKELTNLGYIYAPSFGHAIIKKKIEQAKAMEREQHEETWLDSRVELPGYGLINKPKSFEEYYEETYGKEASHEA